MNVPYLVQLAIWPLIKNTNCYYCIFLRGMLVGAAVTANLAGLFIWVKFYP